MKRRRANITASPLELTPVRTGEHCPESGWWYPTQRQVAEATGVPTSTARFISEGSVMPAVGGRAALWLPGRKRPVAGRFEDLAR
jgi:hypothetical protein